MNFLRLFSKLARTLSVLAALIICKKPFLVCLALLICTLFFCGSAEAQTYGLYNLSDADIGSPGEAGSCSYPSTQTYQVVGGGYGIPSSNTPISDSFNFASTLINGNTEMITQVSTFSAGSGNNYAVAGLMVRASQNPNSAQAFVSVSSKNGVGFTVRPVDGAASTTTLGPTLAAPVYLRIVVSGTTISGYESPDCTSWKLVGSTTINLPQPYYLGFAVSSTNNSSSSTATFSPTNVLTNVPQVSSNLLCWLRGDAGLQYSGTGSGSVVTGWQDQSGNGLNASAPPKTANCPTMQYGSSTAGMNYLPAISLTGSSDQYLSLPTIPSTALSSTSGLSLFVVTKPSSPSTDTRILEFGNGSTTDEIALDESSSTTTAFYNFNGTSATDVSTALASGAQVIDSVYNGSTTASIYVNGAGATSTSMNSLVSIARATNSIGRYGGGSYYFTGTIAEILIYNTALSTSQRQAVENYLMSKYSIATGGGSGTPTLAAPSISPQYTISSTPQTVTITPAAGSSAYYTLNGGSTQYLYTGPFTVSSTGTTTISATSQAPGYTNSAATVANISIDPSVPTVMQSGLQLWLRGDTGVVTGSGTSVTQWYDISGNGIIASGPTTQSEQPTLVTGSSGFNNLPALQFTSSSSQFLQMPTGFGTFSGASIFIVTQPASLSANARFIDFGNGGTSNDIGIEESGTAGAIEFYNYNGSTLSDIVTPSTPLTTSGPQLVEAVQNNSGTGYIYFNGSQVASGSVSDPNSVSRADNYIGRYPGSGSYYLNGKIAEVIVFNTALSTSQRQAIESYLEARYGILVNPPTISPATGVYATNSQTITITADPGAEIFYTSNGTTPTTSSPQYNGPFQLTSAATVNAIAVQNPTSGQQISSVASNVIVVDPFSSLVSRNGLVGWYMASQGVTVTSGLLTSWVDLSGAGNNGTGAGDAEIVSNALNGYAAVRTFSTEPWGPGQVNLPSGYANLTSGATIFAPVGTQATYSPYIITVVDLGNGGTNNDVIFGGQSSLSSPIMTVYQGTSPYESLSGSFASSIGAFHLWCGKQSGNSTGQILIDGQSISSGALLTPNNVTRSTNFMADGGIFPEILIYSRGLDGAEMAALNTYFSHKYAMPLAPAAPTFSVSSISAPTEIGITAPANSTVYVTTNGTTPSPTNYNFIYSVPVQVNYSTTLKAIAVSNGVSGPVASVSYTLNPAKFPAPQSASSGPTLNIQVPTPAQ